MTAFITALSRLLRPPRIVAVTRRPAGWFAVDHRERLAPVVAWGLLTDGVVVALVSGRRRCLRPAVGRGWHGYLPGAPLSANDVQRDPPADVRFVAADLTEAVGDALNASLATQAEIYGRLREAVDDSEPLRRAFVAFTADPERFLTRYWQRLAEHGHVAEVDDNLRDFLNGLTAPKPSARPSGKEITHA